jgi:hypothetical protein
MDNKQDPVSTEPQVQFPLQVAPVDRTKSASSLGGLSSVGLSLAPCTGEDCLHPPLPR